MIYVALAEAIGVIAIASTFAQVVRWLIREHARERNLMLNQLLHLAGRTWEAPPSAEPEPTEDEFADFGALDPSALTEY